MKSKKHGRKKCNFNEGHFLGGVGRFYSEILQTLKSKRTLDDLWPYSCFTMKPHKTHLFMSNLFSE